MSAYYYDGEKAKQISEEFVVKHHIVGEENELGIIINDYLTETVSKILLSKNVALQGNASEQQTADTQNDGSTEDVDKTYLKNLVVRNKNGDIITSPEEMNQWVRDNFYFCLEDRDEPNAWIVPRDENKGQKSVMAVTKKMLEIPDNAAQFEGIIAHELGHYFVQKRYGQQRAMTARSINEKMADMHAADCLVYMGKNPAEYELAFNKLSGYMEMDPIDKLIASIVDEHGGDASRTKDIADYNEAKYGEYLNNYYQSTKHQGEKPQVAEDNQKFADFKRRFRDAYGSGTYISFLEDRFLQDTKFSYAINPTSNRIDFSKIKYEDMLDKLIEIGKNEDIRYREEMGDAAEFLQKSSKEGLEITPELEKKATLFMTLATDSVLANETRRANKKGDANNEKSAKQHIEKLIDAIKQGQNYPHTIENELIAEEFKRTQTVLTPAEVGQRLKQLPQEDRFVYNGQEVTRSTETYQFLQCARTDKEKESDAYMGFGVHFNHDIIIKYKDNNTLVGAIILEAYERDGTVLTAKEVAEKLNETLSEIPDIWAENKKITYNNKEVFISPDMAKKYLLVYVPQSEALSDDDRLRRADVVQTMESPARKKLADNEQFDKLLMAVSYPKIDFTKFSEEYQRSSESKQKTMQIELSKQILNTETIKVEPFSFLRSQARETQKFIQGENPGMPVVDLPKFSRFAINFPTFEMPDEQAAKGQEIPWLKSDTRNLSHFGLRVAEGRSVTDAQTKDFVIDTPQNLFEGEYGKKLYTLVKFPQNKPYQIIIDENGRITAAGTEAEAQLAEQKKEDSRNYAQQISADFRERIKVLDALICLRELSNEEKSRQLLPEEKQKQAEALKYLSTEEGLDTKLIKLRAFLYETTYRSAQQRQEELSYTNMPVIHEDLIAKDLAVLQSSEYYKKFMSGKKVPENPEELVKFMEQTVAWNVGENTSELLQTIVPPAYSILGVRQKNLESSKKLFSREGSIEENFIENIRRSPANKSGSDTDKQAAVSLALSLAYKINQNIESPLEISNYNEIGIEGDSAVYVSQKNIYYEKMREVFNMSETAGNPEQLYRNLSANFTEQELIKTDDHQEQMIRNYQTFLSGYKETDLDVLREKASFDEKYVLDKDMPKLSSAYMKNLYKMAEYETARYLNNPENPPLDCLKLLKAYPIYQSSKDELKHASPEFQDKLSSYILEKTDFKDKGFYEQKEIYDLMVHKGLFNTEKETKAVFAELLQKSYEKLPENEKEKAALSMLQDNTLSFVAYEKKHAPHIYITKKETVSTISSVDVFSSKQYFIQAYAQKFVERMGKEPVVGELLPNGKIAEAKDVEAYQAEIKEFMDNVNATMVQSGVKEKLFALVAEGIEVQLKLAEMFEQAVKHQDNGNDLSVKNELTMRGLNGFNELLSMSPSGNLDMITFFTEPYSEEGVAKLRNNLSNSVIDDMLKISEHMGTEANKEELSREVKSQISEFSKEYLHNMYEEFWSSGIEDRAVVMQRFLNNATQDNNSMAIDICLDKYVSKDNPYYEISKEILNTLYKDGTGVKYYSHNKARFMIGAMLAADRPSPEGEGKKLSIGDALARFCSSNGPAWVKFGQALSNLPMLPPDIREPLSVLKDKAVSKPRWELLSDVRESMPPEALQEIDRFGKMLGAGSFWETISVTSKGETKVLQVMAPNAKKNADEEFAKIIRTIEDLSQQNAQYAVLDRIVKRAKESAEVETDIAKGYDQYVAAKKNYEAFERIEVNGVKFEMKLMPWTSFEQDSKTGNGYKMMDMAKGKGLDKLDCTPEEKRTIAAGYVATELGILLGGKAWDIDRHGGQQNFEIQRSKDGKIEKVVVGIYDTGALRPPPSEEEKVMIANFYAAVIKASVKGENVTEVMFNEVKKLEDRGMNATYVSDVQRGCIAINDLVEYQKAGTDKDGNPVKSQSFGQKDFIKLFGAVISSGAIDRKIADTMLEKMVTDKSVYIALARSAVKAGMHKVKDMFRTSQSTAPTAGDLNIVLQTRSCLRTKEHNQEIDKTHERQSTNNLYSLNTAQPPEKKKSFARKVVRNMQAYFLKRQRSQAGK